MFSARGVFPGLSKQDADFRMLWGYVQRGSLAEEAPSGVFFRPPLIPWFLPGTLTRSFSLFPHEDFWKALSACVDTTLLMLLIVLLQRRLPFRV